jgi:magnesium transporter
VLSLFVPLCISTGGNSGSQAATLITRAMALGQISLGDWWRVLRHELGMGITLGLTLGVIGFARAAITPMAILKGTDRFALAWVVAQAVTIICLWGTLVGSMLPLIFRRLGFDPAYASSPFVATFVDVTGIVIFFSIAKVWILA